MLLCEPEWGVERRRWRCRRGRRWGRRRCPAAPSSPSSTLRSPSTALRFPPIPPASWVRSHMRARPQAPTMPGGQPRFALPPPPPPCHSCIPCAPMKACAGGPAVAALRWLRGLVGAAVRSAADGEWGRRRWRVHHPAGPLGASLRCGLVCRRAATVLRIGGRVIPCHGALQSLCCAELVLAQPDSDPVECCQSRVPAPSLWVLGPYASRSVSRAHPRSGRIALRADLESTNTCDCGGSEPGWCAQDS